MKKKSLALFLILSILTIQAKAFFFLPAAIIAAMELTTAGEIALESSIAIHAGVAAIVFKNKDNPTQTALSVHLDPNKPLITPAGWTPPVDNHSNPTPPQTVSPSFVYVIAYNNIDSAPTIAGACQISAQKNNVTYASNSDRGSYALCFSNTGAYYDQVYQSNTCPTGYGLSNGTCNTINASAVMKPSDNVCEIQRVGNSFKPDTQDPDCANPSNLAKAIAALDPTQKQITVTDKATQQVTTVKIMDNGSSQVIHDVPQSNGTTTRDTIDVSPTADGQTQEVTGTKHETFQGQGTQATLPSTSQGSLDISSLNKESTQTHISAELDSLSTKQCGFDISHPCNSKLDESGVDAVTSNLQGTKSSQLSTIDGWYDSLIQKGNQTTEGVGHGYTTPITDILPDGGTCENPVFDATNIFPTAIATLHICEHSSEVQPLLKWATYVYTLVACWGVLFTKVGGT